MELLAEMQIPAEPDGFLRESAWPEQLEDRLVWKGETEGESFSQADASRQNECCDLQQRLLSASATALVYVGGAAPGVDCAPLIDDVCSLCISFAPTAPADLFQLFVEVVSRFGICFTVHPNSAGETASFIG